MDDIRAVESTVTSQTDRIRRLEENALNNLSPDILQLIKIVSRELDLANALAEVTDELIVCLESMYVEDILGARTTDNMVGDAEALRQINKRLADVCTGRSPVCFMNFWADSLPTSLLYISILLGQ